MKSLYLSVLMLLVGCGWGGTQSTLPTGQITVNGLERSYDFISPRICLADRVRSCSRCMVQMAATGHFRRSLASPLLRKLKG